MNLAIEGTRLAGKFILNKDGQVPPRTGVRASTTWIAVVEARNAVRFCRCRLIHVKREHQIGIDLVCETRSVTVGGQRQIRRRTAGEEHCGAKGG